MRNAAKYIALFFAVIATLLSATMSGRYGYTIGKPDLFNQYMWMAVLVFVSFGAGVLWWFVGGLFSVGRWKLGLFVVPFALLVSTIDLGSGAGQASLTREGKTLLSKNNLDAVHKREARISRLRKRITKAESEPLYSAILRTAEAYRNHKSQLERKLVPGSRRSYFKRSKSCTDADLPESVAFCLEWEAAKTGISNAEEKTRLHADVDRWTQELSNVESEVIANPETLAGTVAQSTFIAKLMFRRLKPFQSDKDVAEIGMQASLGVVSSLAAIVFAIIAGLVGKRSSADGFRQYNEDPVLVADQRGRGLTAKELADLIPDVDRREFELKAAKTIDPHGPNVVDASTLIISGNDQKLHRPAGAEEALRRYQAAMAVFRAQTV